jgi:hypothetical protein
MLGYILGDFFSQTHLVTLTECLRRPPEQGNTKTDRKALTDRRTERQKEGSEERRRSLGDRGAAGPAGRQKYREREEEGKGERERERGGGCAKTWMPVVRARRSLCASVSCVALFLSLRSPLSSFFL